MARLAASIAAIARAVHAEAYLPMVAWLARGPAGRDPCVLVSRACVFACAWQFCFSLFTGKAFPCASTIGEVTKTRAGSVRQSVVGGRLPKQSMGTKAVFSFIFMEVPALFFLVFSKFVTGKLRPTLAQYSKAWATFDRAICVRSYGPAKQHNCLLCLLPYLADLHNQNARYGITGQG
jgi:hypothetical protein